MSQDARISEQDSRFIELGKLGRPHGVSGEIRLYLHNPSSDFIFSVQSVYLSAPDSDAVDEYGIHRVKSGPRFHILSLKDVRNRNRAQQLNGLVLKVPRAMMPPLDDEEFYVADLMGIDVTHQGNVIGRIVDSRAQGGIEVITVANDVREIQIPLVDDYVVHKDIPNKLIEVRNIDELPVFEFSGKGR